MKKIFSLLFISTATLSFSSKSIIPSGEKSSKTIIIQFQTMDFEKRIDDLVGASKELHGIEYIGHCYDQRLFVLQFDLHRTGGLDIDNAVRNIIPTDLSHEYKEGTLEQLKSAFGNCLTKDNK